MSEIYSIIFVTSMIVVIEWSVPGEILLSTDGQTNELTSNRFIIIPGLRIYILWVLRQNIIVENTLFTFAVKNSRLSRKIYEYSYNYNIHRSDLYSKYGFLYVNYIILTFLIILKSLVLCDVRPAVFIFATSKVAEGTFK